MNKSLSAFLGAVSAVMLLAACSATAPTDSGDQQSSSSVLIMEPGADGIENDSAMPVPGTDTDEMDVQVDVDAGVSVEVMTPRVVTIAASNFAFSPNGIVAKKGEKVTLRLTSTEGNHGFGVPDLGINTTMFEGKTVDVELPTDKTGTFSFKCSVPCGSGHRDMTGTITITE